MKFPLLNIDGSKSDTIEVSDKIINSKKELLKVISIELNTIKDKYLTPFRPKNTKPKDDKAKARSAKAKAKLDSELNVLLADDGVKDIIDTSVSKEEAQAKIKSFING